MGDQGTCIAGPTGMLQLLQHQAAAKVGAAAQTWADISPPVILLCSTVKNYKHLFCVCVDVCHCAWLYCNLPWPIC
jgi:hypothetical protein